MSKGIFPKEAFVYNRDTDNFICPAGQTLRKRNYYKKRKHYEYKASSKICAQCQLREKCTRAKNGRTLKRHARQGDLDLMLKCAGSRQSKKDIRTRQHLSERSFAQSKPHGYKRARWRKLWKMSIQDFLIAAVQNIQILINSSKSKVESNVNALAGRLSPRYKDQRPSIWPVFFLKTIWEKYKFIFNHFCFFKPSSMES